MSSIGSMAIRIISCGTQRLGNVPRPGRLMLLICACLMGSISASAQYSKSSSSTDNFTSAAFGPGTPNGSIDSVDFFTGHVSANLPIFTFGGRGEVGYTAYATINRTYNIHVNQTWSAPGQYQGQWNQPYFTLTSEGFFEDLSRGEVKAGMRPGVIFVRHMRNASPDPGPGLPDQISCNTLTKLYFRTSVGDTEFRDAGTNGLDEFMTGNNTFHRGTVWVSRDGSAMTFVSDTDIVDESCAQADYQSMNGENVEFPSGYLYAKNGVRYRVVNGQVTWMSDRNGNVMTFSPGDTSTVTDPAGRTYTIQTLAYGAAIQAQSVQYRGAGGVQRTVSVTYTALANALRQDAIDRGGVQPLGQLFRYIVWQQPNLAFNPTVLSEVTLADGRKYKFKYNEFGELARIEHPNGSIVEFDYIPIGINNGEVLNNQPQIDRRVSVRRYYDSEGVLSGTTTYERVEESNDIYAVRVKVYDADNTLLSYIKHYIGLVENDYILSGWYPPYSDGKEYKSEVCDASGNPLVRVEYDWVPDVNSTVLLSDVKTTLVPTNEVKKTAYSYDRYANVTDTYNYDYGTGNPGALLSRTHTGYVTDPAYTDPTGAHLRSLARETWVSTDAGGDIKVAMGDVEYDNYTRDPTTGNRHAALLPRDHISGLCLKLDDNFNCLTLSDSNYQTRGNATGKTQYLLANDGSSTGSVTVNLQYDVAGNVIKSIDGRRKPDQSGYETSYDFQDRFGAPDDEARSNSVPPELAQPSGTLSSYAFPTTITDALGHNFYAQYDYYTGRVVNTEDANGIVSNTQYEDALDRPTKTERAVNVPALHSQTTIVYDDLNRTITTTSDQTSLDDNQLKTVTIYNGLGLTVESRQYETATQYIAILTKYDALGRLSQASNPYRPTLSETPVWSKMLYDLLGRVTAITTPDNATVYTLYDGLRTLVTDQAGRQRITKVDALGNLTDVWEVVSPSSPDPDAESVTFPVPQGVSVPAVSKGYRTSYTYDVLKNLRKVVQGSQRRYFAYDSFGRIIRAKNPEQDSNTNLTLPANMVSALSDNNNDWTLKFDYDEDGNVTVKTDARGLTVTNTYDGLGRPTFVDYSDSTPDVTYTYDDAGVANSKGRLTSVSTSASVNSYTAYDALGRVTASAQTTDGVTYTMPDYRYDLAGDVTSEQYPSGRVVKTEYDAAGRIAGVKNQATGLYYAGGDPSVPNNQNVISYAASGAATDVKLGNGLWEHTSFNARLQPEHIYLGSTKGSSSVLGLDYSYGTTDNNGNVQSQTITLPGISTPYVQSYSYDQLNRLQSAEETIGTTSNWKQVYSYDRFGNRNLATVTTFPNYTQTPTDPTTHLPIDPVGNPVIDPTNNRIKSSVTGQGNYQYDAAGNLLCDSTHLCTQTPQFIPYYTYDAENRVTSAGGGPTNGGSSYFYDGVGERVKKVVGSDATVFVYDAAGRLVAEYDNGQPQAGGTNYVTADHLGSTRAVTGQTQQVTGRYDYLPFGEEVYLSRSEYGGNIRQKFTQQERDNELSLDFFASRYYSPAQGRFTSPDSLAGSPVNPQTLNLYAYVRGNPLKYSDPNGHRAQDPQNQDNLVPLPPAGPDIICPLYPSCGTGAVPCVADEYTIPTSASGTDLTIPAGNRPPELPWKVQALMVLREGVRQGLDPYTGTRQAGFSEQSIEEWKRFKHDTSMALLPLALEEAPEEAAEEMSEAVAGDIDTLIEEEIIEVTVDANKHPESAEHILDAQSAGYPDAVTIDRAGAAERRAESLKGIPKIDNKQLDEYPPAMFRENGGQAAVRPITSSDNMGAGASIGNQLRGIPNGTRVRIKVKR
jgi:RHS repeat-associated protein